MSCSLTLSYPANIQIYIGDQSICQMRQLSREVLELIDYNLKKRDYYKEDNNLSNIYICKKTMKAPLLNFNRYNILKILCIKRYKLINHYIYIYMSLYLWDKESNINLNYSVSTTVIGLTIEYIFGFLFIESFFFFFSFFFCVRDCVWDKFLVCKGLSL